MKLLLTNQIMNLVELKGQIENIFKGELRQEFLKYISGQSIGLKLLEFEDAEPMPGRLGYYSPESKTIHLSKVVGPMDNRLDRLSVIVHEMAHAFVNRKGQANGLVLDVTAWFAHLVNLVPTKDFYGPREVWSNYIEEYFRNNAFKTK